MAIYVQTDVTILVNGVNLSDHLSKVTLTDDREKIDVTTMGATSKVSTKGLGDAKAVAEFFQDFAAAKVHATIQPLIGSTSPITIEVRPTSAVRSATNPAWSMSALVFAYGMLDGKVGDASTVSVEFDNAAAAGVTYLTA